MERFAIKKLIEWKDSADRKPMVLRGARQVGKTTVLRQLMSEDREYVTLDDFEERNVNRLSGGQQQRVLLARALCATRKLLLLDEPVAGLDPKAMAELYDLIRTLNEEGVTIIMISHDISAALKYASHVLHLDRKCFFGTREEYLESDAGKKFLLLQKMEEQA